MKLWLINPEEEILIKVSKLESILQCPVCLETVRELPVPCCQAGHIICRECKANPNLLQCPTCRRRYLDEEMTCSAIASMIDVLPHKCKFSRFGCKEKLALDELIKHEAKCPERTVTCSHRNHSSITRVQLKMFSKHVEEFDCGLKGELPMKVPFELKLPLDSESLKEDYEFLIRKFTGSLNMCYLGGKFFHQKDVLFLYTMMNEDGESHRAKITLHGADTSCSYESPCLSIESVPFTGAAGSGFMKNISCWGLPLEFLKEHCGVEFKDEKEQMSIKLSLELIK